MGDAHEDISFSSTTWDIINEIDKFLEDYKEPDTETNNQLNTNLVLTPNANSLTHHCSAENDEVEFIGENAAVFELLEDTDQYGIYEHNPNETNWNVFYKTLPPGTHEQNIKKEPGTEYIEDNSDGIDNYANLSSSSFQNEIMNTNVNQQIKIKREPNTDESAVESHKNTYLKQTPVETFSFDSSIGDISSNIEKDNVSVCNDFTNQKNTDFKETPVETFSFDSTIGDIISSNIEKDNISVWRDFTNQKNTDLNETPVETFSFDSSIGDISSNIEKDNVSVCHDFTNQKNTDFKETPVETFSFDSTIGDIISSNIEKENISVSCDITNQKYSDLKETPFETFSFDSSIGDIISSNIEKDNISIWRDFTNQAFLVNNTNQNISVMKENLFPNLKNSAVETNKIHYLSKILSSGQTSTTLSTSSTSMANTNRSEVDVHKDDIKDYDQELKKPLFSDKTSTSPSNLNCEDNEDQDGILKQSYSNKPSTSNTNFNPGCSVPYNPEYPENYNNYETNCVDQDTKQDSESIAPNQYEQCNSYISRYSQSCRKQQKNNRKPLKKNKKRPMRENKRYKNDFVKTFRKNLGANSKCLTSNKLQSFNTQFNKTNTNDIQTIPGNKQENSFERNDIEIQNLHAETNNTKNSQFSSASFPDRPLDNHQQPNLPFTSTLNKPYQTSSIENLIPKNVIDLKEYDEQVTNRSKLRNVPKNDHETQNLHTETIRSKHSTYNKPYQTSSERNHKPRHFLDTTNPNQQVTKSYKTRREPKIDHEIPNFNTDLNSSKSLTYNKPYQESFKDNLEPKNVIDLKDYDERVNNRSKQFIEPKNNHEINNLHTETNNTKPFKSLSASVPERSLDNIQKPNLPIASTFNKQHQTSSDDNHRHKSVTDITDNNERVTNLSKKWNEPKNDFETQNLQTETKISNHSTYNKPYQTFSEDNHEPKNVIDLKDHDERNTNRFKICKEPKDNYEIQNLHMETNCYKHSKFSSISILDSNLDHFQQPNLPITSTFNNLYNTSSEDNNEPKSVMDLSDNERVTKRSKKRNNPKKDHEIQNLLTETKRSKQSTYKKPNQTFSEDNLEHKNVIDLKDHDDRVTNRYKKCNEPKNNHEIQNLHTETNSSTSLSKSIPDRPLENIQQPNLPITFTFNKQYQTLSDNNHRPKNITDKTDNNEQVTNRSNKRNERNNNIEIQNLHTETKSSKHSTYNKPNQTFSEENLEPKHVIDLKDHDRVTNRSKKCNVPKNNHEIQNLHSESNSSKPQSLSTSVPDRPLDNIQQPNLPITSTFNKQYQTLSDDNHRPTNITDLKDNNEQVTKRSKKRKERKNDLETLNLHTETKRSKHSTYKKPYQTFSEENLEPKHVIDLKDQDDRVTNRSKKCNVPKNNLEIQNLHSETNSSKPQPLPISVPDRPLDNIQQTNLPITSTINKQYQTLSDDNHRPTNITDLTDNNEQVTKRSKKRKERKNDLETQNLHTETKRSKHSTYKKPYQTSSGNNFEPNNVIELKDNDERVSNRSTKFNEPNYNHEIQNLHTETKRSKHSTSKKPYQTSSEDNLEPKNGIDLKDNDNRVTNRSKKCSRPKNNHDIQNLHTETNNSKPSQSLSANVPDRPLNNFQQPNLPITSTFNKLYQPSSENNLESKNLTNLTDNNERVTNRSKKRNKLKNDQEILNLTTETIRSKHSTYNKPYQTSSEDNLEPKNVIDLKDYDERITNRSKKCYEPKKNHDIQNLHTETNSLKHSEFSSIGVPDRVLDNFEQPNLSITSTFNEQNQTSSEDNHGLINFIDLTNDNERITNRSKKSNKPKNDHEIQNLHTKTNISKPKSLVASVPDRPLDNFQQPNLPITSTFNKLYQPSSENNLESKNLTNLTDNNERVTNRSKKRNKLKNDQEILNLTTETIRSKHSTYNKPYQTSSEDNLEPKNVIDLKDYDERITNRSKKCYEPKKNHDIQNLHTETNSLKHSELSSIGDPDRPLENFQQPNLSITSTFNEQNQTSSEDNHGPINFIDLTNDNERITNRSKKRNKPINDHETQNLHTETKISKHSTYNKPYETSSEDNHGPKNFIDLTNDNERITNRSKKRNKPVNDHETQNLHTETKRSKHSTYNKPYQTSSEDNHGPKNFIDLTNDNERITNRSKKRNKPVNDHETQNLHTETKRSKHSTYNKPYQTSSEDNHGPKNFIDLTNDNERITNRSKQFIEPKNNHEIQNLHTETNNLKPFKSLSASVPDRPLDNIQQPNLPFTSTNSTPCNTLTDNYFAPKVIMGPNNFNKNVIISNSLNDPKFNPEISDLNTDTNISKLSTSNKPCQTSSEDNIGPKIVMDLTDNNERVTDRSKKRNKPKIDHKIQHLHTETNNSKRSTFNTSSMNSNRPGHFFDPNDINTQVNIRSKTRDVPKNDNQIQNLHTKSNSSESSTFKKLNQTSSEEIHGNKHVLDLTNVNKQTTNNFETLNEPNNDHEILNVHTETITTEYSHFISASVSDCPFNNLQQPNVPFTSTCNEPFQTLSKESHGAKHVLDKTYFNKQVTKSFKIWNGPKNGHNEIHNLQTVTNMSNHSQFTAINVLGCPINNFQQPNLPFTSTNSKPYNTLTEDIHNPKQLLCPNDFNNQVVMSSNILIETINDYEIQNSHTVTNSSEYSQFIPANVPECHFNNLQQPNLPLTSINSQPFHTLTGVMYGPGHFSDLPDFNKNVQHKQVFNGSTILNEHKNLWKSTDLVEPFIKCDASSNDHDTENLPQEKTDVLNINVQKSLHDNVNKSSTKELVQVEYNIIKDYLSPETLVGCTVKFSSRKLANTMIRDEIEVVLSTHGVLENSWWTPDDLYFVTYKTRSIAQYVFKLYPKNRTSSY